MLGFLKRAKRVEIEEFPPCAPELNPVDRVWAYVKRARLGNYVPNDLPRLRNRLNSEFRLVRRKQNVLRWCVKEAGLGSALDLALIESNGDCNPIEPF
jgi:transposase